MKPDQKSTVFLPTILLFLLLLRYHVALLFRAVLEVSVSVSNFLISKRNSSTKIAPVITATVDLLSKIFADEVRLISVGSVHGRKD